MIMQTETAEQTIEEIKSQLDRVRAMYGDCVRRRIEQLESENYFELAEPDALARPFLEEENLLEESNRLRRLLVAKNPSEYHYGRMSKNELKRTEPVLCGDDGYYICACCKKTFKYEDVDRKILRERNFNGRRVHLKHETFKNCAMHEGFKASHTLVLREDEVKRLSRYDGPQGKVVVSALV